ncbi:MAG: hypothetical protein JWP63_1902, partial [Candidatus Solibacter sp.]|nr:hypothetical protein [Candidatus Solibacter sp.]
VRLEYPSSALEDGLHMPNIARPVFREGFLGDYGEKRALDLLEGLYRAQKRGTARRKDFASDRGDFEEFGRVRYVAVNPGHPQRDRTIIERGEISSSVSAQLEDDGPYRYARLFDTPTGQPFLGEASVVETSIAEYVLALKQDVAFQLFLQDTQRKLRTELTNRANQLKAFALSPRQLELLQDFKRAQLTGDLGLLATEIESLIELGYLLRDPQRGVAEKRTLEQAIERQLESAQKFDLAGRPADAERSRAKARRLRTRIEVITLAITGRGKRVAKEIRSIDFD